MLIPSLLYQVLSLVLVGLRHVSVYFTEICSTKTFTVTTAFEIKFFCYQELLLQSRTVLFVKFTIKNCLLLLIKNNFSLHRRNACIFSISWWMSQIWSTWVVKLVTRYNFSWWKKDTETQEVKCGLQKNKRQRCVFSLVQQTLNVYCSFTIGVRKCNDMLGVTLFRFRLLSRRNYDGNNAIKFSLGLINLSFITWWLRPINYTKGTDVTVHWTSISSHCILFWLDALALALDTVEWTGTSYNFELACSCLSAGRPITGKWFLIFSWTRSPWTFIKFSRIPCLKLNSNL